MPLEPPPCQRLHGGRESNLDAGNRIGQIEKFLESIYAPYVIAIDAEQVWLQVIEAGPVFEQSRRLHQLTLDRNSKNVRAGQRCCKVQVQRDFRIVFFNRITKSSVFSKASSGSSG